MNRTFRNLYKSCFNAAYTCARRQGTVVPLRSLVADSPSAANIAHSIPNTGIANASANQTKATSSGESAKSGGGEKQQEGSSWKDRWTGKNYWKLGMLSMSLSCSATAGYILVSWGSPKRDENGNLITDEFTKLPSWQQYPRRAWYELMNYQRMIQDPFSDKLLPDAAREPYYQPPYTLVVELTGVLVHPDWTYQTGWRFKKRPAVEHFLQQCGPPLFELVIFTHEPLMTAFPIIDSLDKENMFIAHRLFRDSTRYRHGTHIKDLSCLNRDLSRVIFVDWNPAAGQLQTRNMLNLKKWRGEDTDATLVDLAAFLRTIALSGVDDVRPVLDYYRQFDDPLFVFRQNQRKLLEQKKAEEAQQSTSHLKPSRFSFSNFTRGSSR